MDELVHAEFEVLRLMGIDIYRTAELDGDEPIWCPRQSALFIGEDLTADEAENVACEVLGMIAMEMAV